MPAKCSPSLYWPLGAVSAFIVVSATCEMGIHVLWPDIVDRSPGQNSDCCSLAELCALCNLTCKDCTVTFHESLTRGLNVEMLKYGLHLQRFCD